MPRLSPFAPPRLRLGACAVLALSLISPALPPFQPDAQAKAQPNAQANPAGVRPASSTLKAGLDAVSRRQTSAALAALEKLGDGSLERRTLTWALAVSGANLDARTLSAFAADVAAWPAQEIMRENLERVMADEASAATLRATFAQSAPITMAAAEKLAAAHLAAGDKAGARRAIADHWRDGLLGTSRERRWLDRFGSVLTREDHRARVEYLLSRNRIRGAQRLAGKAGATRLVAARAAVVRKQRDAASRLKAVPASQKSDPNYLLSRAIWLRQRDRISAAAETHAQVKADAVHPAAGDAHWRERRILASDLLEAGKSKLAYRVVRTNVATSARRRIDADFYAGFIALRERNAPGVAQKHFRALLEQATRPLSRSRGHYWLGRALAASGDKAAATAEFEKAAKFDTTYYGQLASQRIGRNQIAVSRAKPTAEDRDRFERYELVRAITKLESAGHDRRARVIYDFLARQLTKPGELALLAARAEKQGDYRLSLQVGKRAHFRGFDVDTLAWPIGAIPKGTRTSGAGLPLAYAIARQESAFQVDARSSANALGLLQLLPGTARETARSIGVKYSRSRLTSDAAYNARLGTAFLEEQRQRFGGSYILTFVAYNAGPRRAQEWIKRFGDPRGKPLDEVIDWVERIPFGETRSYVQRVMENYQVYKARLRGAELSAARDLRAGRRG